MQDVEYFDVYSPVINSKYSEVKENISFVKLSKTCSKVFWTMMDPVPLDKDIVEKFKGKTMAVVGYETDQVNIIFFSKINIP